MKRFASPCGLLLLTASLGCASATAPPVSGSGAGGSGTAAATGSIAVATAAPTPAPVATSTPTPVPAAFHSALLWQRTSAEHRAIHLQVFREANEAVARLAAGKERGTWAVSVDADETLIDNSLYALERERAASSYAAPTWNEWVKRRAATPVPGAAAFLTRVQNLGGLVAVITNRGQAECDDTRENLRQQKIPFDVLLCRPDGADGRKEGRWQALASGTAVAGLRPLEILVWVGDNIRDFPGLDQNLRDQDESAFALFGERYFVLPNPVYGSWERNTER